MHTSFTFLLKNSIVERIPPKGFVIQKWQYFEVIKTNGETKSVSALS